MIMQKERRSEGQFSHTDFRQGTGNALKNRKPNEADEKISRILIKVGIVPNVKGYRYLRDAVLIAMDNMDVMNSITKGLYPMVAENFDTSSSRVERAIRHAIEIATNSGKREHINALFGMKIYAKNERPTNSEFIALLADRLIMDFGFERSYSY